MAIIVLVVLSFVTALILEGPATAVIIAGIQILTWFFDIGSKRKDKKRKKIIENAYKTEQELHPDITDPSVIESLVRKRLWRYKLKRAGTYFGVGVLFFIVFILLGVSSNAESSLVKFFAGISLMVSSVLQIIAIMSFAGSLHDPLTPNEAMELARKDDIEKGGE